MAKLRHGCTRITRAPLSFAYYDDHFSINLGFSDEPTELMNIIKPKFQHISECYMGWKAIVRERARESDRGIQKKERGKLVARISQSIMHFHQTCMCGPTPPPCTRTAQLCSITFYCDCVGTCTSHMQFVRLMPFHRYWNVVEFNVYSFSHSIDARIKRSRMYINIASTTPQHVHKFCEHMVFLLLFKCWHFVPSFYGLMYRLFILHKLKHLNSWKYVSNMFKCCNTQRMNNAHVSQ